jgi:hypothetical protein
MKRNSTTNQLVVTPMRMPKTRASWIERPPGENGGEAREIDRRLLDEIDAVRRPDRDGQRVHAGLRHETPRLLGIGVQLGVVAGLPGLDRVRRADPPQLGLDRETMPTRERHDRPGLRDILREQQLRGVDHHRGEPGGDRRLDRRHVLRVVEVQHDRHGDPERGELPKKLLGEGGGGHAVMLELGPRDLRDQRGARRLRRLERRAQQRQIARRERAERVPRRLSSG